MRFQFFSGYEYSSADSISRPPAGELAVSAHTRPHIAIAIYTPSIALTIITGLPLHQCVLIMGSSPRLYTTLVE
jgi:hypothetical protein